MTEKELLKILKKSNKKKKSSFSKRIVILVILLNISYAVATFYAFLKVGSEPGVLTVAWFAFTTGELWLLKSIKNKEIEEGGKDDEHEDRLEDETFK